ncbi:MAG: dihydrodipicolinate synthase family protein [Pseudohongiellaceae bacterium]
MATTSDTTSGAERFSGVLAPVITPFREDLSPDQDKFNRHCQWLLGQGVNLAVFGTNSEANSLGLQEKRGLLDGLLKAGVSPAQLMPGTGNCSLIDAVELTRHAVAAGCRGVLMLPPFYYKGVSDDGLFRFYAEVIERVGDAGLAGVKLYLYNFPLMSQVPLSVALIDRLVQAYPDAVAGVKDSSGDWDNIQAMLNRNWPDFRVFCGSESLLLQTLRSGGAGCISATANVNPAAIARLHKTWADDDADADSQQAQLDVIRQIFQSLPIIPALKAATADYSGDEHWARLRPPLVALNSEQRQALRQALGKAGFQMPALT